MTIYILGLMTNGHDTSACLLRDGEVAGLIEEERLSRIKHTTAFPYRAIDALLSRSAITMDDVSYVGFTAGYGFRQSWNFFIHFLPSVPVRRWPLLTYKNIYSSFTFFRDVRRFRGTYQYKGKILYIDHHHAHLANAFLASPFKESAILSIDGSGEGYSSKMAVGRGNTISEFDAVTRPESIGVFYQLITRYLGFRHYGDEGKVMGLAPYGKPRYEKEFQKVIQPIEDGTYRMNRTYFTITAQGKLTLSEKFYDEFGPPRKEEEKLQQHHKDIAASLQRVTEELMFYLVRYVHTKTGAENLCLSGGVMLNSVANGMLHRRTPFRNIFIQPVAYDAGNALGCCLSIWHEHLGNSRSFVERNVYWGPEFTSSEIAQILQARGVAYTSCDHPETKAAELIAKGKVVGWFQGRLEAGARALGNRSILADPRRAEMKDVVNNRVKHRESFRPFAPSILAEYVNDYFEDSVPAPYMERVFPIKKEKRPLIPAVTHVDGTGRLQTISRNDNPLYYDLIRHFQKITGIPIVLNTSFNVRGEPMVCTPEEALNDFLATEMDMLFLGKCLIDKKAVHGGGRAPLVSEKEDKSVDMI